MSTIHPITPADACRVCGKPTLSAPRPCVARGDDPMRDLPLWGPRIEVDGAALDFHEINGYRVDLSLPRHLITYWLESSQSTRALDSNRPEKVRFERGSFNVTPAGSRLKASSEQSARVLQFSIDPGFIQRVAPEHIAAQSGALPPLQGVSVPSMQHLAELARGLLLHAGAVDRLYFESLMILVLMEVVTRTRSTGPQQPPLPSGPKSTVRMNRARDYIAAHLGQPLSLSALAAAANMSMYHFARSFKQTFGSSPHQYVVRERFEKSKQLLDQPQHSISEIAQLCGFSNQAHFTQVFKRYQDMTPSEFRKHRSN